MFKDGRYREKDLLGGRRRAEGGRVCKREKMAQFAILKTKENGRESDFAKTSGIVTEDAPFSYWPIALSCSQVFAKVNSAQFPYFSKVARSGVA